MSLFNSDNSTYNIHVENEAIKVLSNLNEDSIYDIVMNNIRQIPNFNLITPVPNTVAMLEQNFKQTIVLYPESIQEVFEYKTVIYKKIIQIIQEYYQLEINIPEDANDLYSYAYYLYDFFVNNFKNNVVLFFANYIYKEKNNIYTALELSSKKKQKSSSIGYGKKVYANTKITAINAFIDTVLDNLTIQDITFEDILSNVYSDSNIVQFILSFVGHKTDFYKTYYASLVLSPVSRSSLISNVRLTIHNYAI